MPRIAFGGSADLAKATLGDVDAYDEAKLGVPVKGIYRVRVKRLTLKKNKNNDWMLNAVAEIAEPKDSDKSRYNAYGMWFNLNVNAKGAKGVNNFLLAISGGSQAVVDVFWTKGVKTSDDKLKPAVLAIGRLQINPDGMMASALTRYGTDQTGTKRLDIDRFLMRNGAPEEAEYDEDDGDDVIVVEGDEDSGGEGETGDGIIGDTSDVDTNIAELEDEGGDYDDEPEYVEEEPTPPEETGEDAAETSVPDDEPPF